MNENIVALRMDDVGASSKKYEIYSNHRWGIGPIGISANFLFLKYLKPFKKWGPYDELTSEHWLNIIDILKQYNGKLTVAVTAAWIDSENQIIPFPEKFPDSANILKEGVNRGYIEIANHGYSHCVIQNNLFKPKLFSGNRNYHREFWDWISIDIQDEHIRRSQEILQNYFSQKIVTFVPPGNVFSEQTLKIAEKYGIKYVSCNTSTCIFENIVVLGDNNKIMNSKIMPFHDRDIILNKMPWFKFIVSSNFGKKFCFIKEIGENLGLQLSLSH